MPQRRALRIAQVVAAVMVVAGTTAFAWWLIGDQSTVGPRVLSHEPPLLRLDSARSPTPEVYMPNYVWQPLDIPPSTERVVGLLGAAAAVLGGAILIATRSTFRAGWWGVIAALLVVGCGSAAAHRLLTAGVSGANLAVGLVLFIGFPLALAIIFGAAAASYGLLRSTPRPTA